MDMWVLAYNNCSVKKNFEYPNEYFTLYPVQNVQNSDACEEVNWCQPTWYFGEWQKIEEGPTAEDGQERGLQSSGPQKIDGDTRDWMILCFWVFPFLWKISGRALKLVSFSPSELLPGFCFRFQGRFWFLLGSFFPEDSSRGFVTIEFEIEYSSLFTSLRPFSFRCGQEIYLIVPIVQFVMKNKYVKMFVTLQWFQC